MSFAYPWVLLAAPLVLWFIRRRHSRSSVKVSSTQLWTGLDSRRIRFLWLPVLFRHVSILLILFSLARPQLGKSFDVQISEGIAIQMLVDVSSSMDMNVGTFAGERVSRMELSREMVKRFIAGDGDKLKGRPNDLIGLITFARYADTRSPLTFGHEALLQIVRNLDVQERPNEDGTAYGDALAIAAARLNKLEDLKYDGGGLDFEKIQSKVIILLTDGENNSGAHLPIEAAGLAKSWGCKIYVISLGDTNVAEGQNPAAALLTPPERVLQHIANETGGVFRQAHDVESLISVYSEIDTLERSEITSRSYDRITEWFWLPLALALVALILALVLEATWLRIVP